MFDYSTRIQKTETLYDERPPADILVVIPTYNEKENIQPLFEALRSLHVCPDILIVDDGSPDGTVEAVRVCAQSWPGRVSIMSRCGKFGLGIAYLDAYRWLLAALPEYPIIIQMDADFSHDPHMLSLLAAQAQAYGIAVGSRYVEGGATPDWSRWRLWLSRLGNIYARLVLRIFFPAYLLKDSTSGFIAWRRDVLARVMDQTIMGDGYAYQTSVKVAAFRLGYPAIEVPIVFRDRRLGVSKLSRHIIMEAILIPWKLGKQFS
jgi:dolichol-phosphate mannosyltransferase